MIKLKNEFSKKGFNFVQLFKDDELAIYQLSRQHADGDGISKWYEVFKVQVKQPDIYHNDEFEKYPNDEAFGVWAWSCSNEQVVNKVLKREFPNHPLSKGGFQAI